MFKLLISFALLAAVVVAGGGGGEDPSISIDGVLDLTPANFDEVVGKDKGVLIEFYAPWCGHCKTLVPVMGQLGAAVKAVGGNKVAIAKVNADAHSELGSRFGVKGFPTIKFFPAGSVEPEEYQGGRDTESFIKFLNGKTSAGLFVPKTPTFVTILGSHNFDAVVGKDKGVLVEFYAPWCGHCKTLAPKYEIVAKSYLAEKNFVVASVNADEAENKALASRFGVTGFPTIKFFPAGSTEPEEYQGGRDTEDFISFINEKSGAQRIAGGDLSPIAGLDEELTALAKKFIAAPAKTIRDEIEARAKAVGTIAAGHYTKVADKVLENVEYAAKELTRLEKVLAGKVSLARKDDMQYRRNVLSVFKKE